MRGVLFHVALAALLAFVQARGVVLESLRSVPVGWRRVGNADPSQEMRLRVALVQPHAAVFEQTLYDVSDPEHPLYGRHLKRDELAKMMKPSDVSTAAVLNWLSEAGIPSSQVEDEGDWINFRITVGDAESLLDTDFAIYTYLDTNIKKLGALEYSVPKEVAPHITMIAPIIRFGQIRPQRSHIFKVIEAAPADTAVHTAEAATSKLNLTECNDSITPWCLRALYKVGDYEADPSDASVLGVAGYLNQYAKHDQLELFNNKYAPYAADANFSVVTINGGRNDQEDTEHNDVEANLDMQYAVSMSYKTPVSYYSTGGRAPSLPDLDQPLTNQSFNEPYLDFLTYMLRQPDSKLPRTLTTSYGEDEQAVPAPYVRKVCQMFGQLGARGVSVIFASGDTGPGSGCQTNDGKNTTRFLPIFPSACPYVTSVGATFHVGPEEAAPFSSGGFSDVFARPRYQKAAVARYLGRLGCRWAGLYNRAGRGFPDVAAQGDGFHVFTRGEDVLVSGTSASAPVFAGLVSLLNSNRLRAGKPPMGFLNPWLYTAGLAGFTDIVDGGSEGCTGTAVYSGLPAPFVPFAGWNATPGWDPVTGLGTPLFDKLLDLSST